MSHQCYQEEKVKWSQTAQWTLLFLTRFKSGWLYLQQNSKTRTKTHHQRKPKTLRNNVYRKHHVQALTTSFAVRTLKTPRFPKQLCNCRFYFRKWLSRWFLIGIRKVSKNHLDDQSRKSNRQIPTKRIDWSLSSKEAWGAINHKNTEKQHLHRQNAQTRVTRKRIRS